MADQELIELLKKGPEAWNGLRAKYPEPDLSRANLNGANLEEADLRKANLMEAHLSGADLSGANLAGASLEKANLSGAILDGANLVEADLHKANLMEADIVDADLIRADLMEADLSRADLTSADLREADLSGAVLTRARLLGAHFSEAVLGGTNFVLAILGWTGLGDLDLREAVGLESVRHHGPSSIGIDTLLKSGGRIPGEFLRGCGVDPLIQDVLVGDPHARTEAFTQLLSTVHRPFQRCFISYATEDKAFADRLQQALNKNGVDYWYAPEHGKWGERLDRQIGIEISLRDRMLLICSETSLQKDWVEFEIERAIEKEKKTSSQVIFPIMLDDALLKWTHPRATRIREVLAGDFRKATKGEAFDKAAKKLLDALRR